MLSTDQMSLNYRLFPDRIRKLFGAMVQEEKDLDRWHYGMMGQTMLIRNAERLLYLAIPVDAYDSFFTLELPQLLIQRYQVHLIVYEPAEEVIVLWKK